MQLENLFQIQAYSYGLSFRTHICATSKLYIKSIKCIYFKNTLDIDFWHNVFLTVGTTPLCCFKM